MVAEQTVASVSVGRLHVRQNAAKNPLANTSTLGHRSVMNREQVESAVARGVPFSLLMADGKEYQVPHRDYISFPPKAPYVIVYDDAGHFTVLPLLTMTGLQTTVSDASATQK